jgi:superfamily I DNA/RNA helicase
MAKEKWLIDPGELDEFQREIRGLKLSDSYVIKGGAGSGKTILALYRASDIRIATVTENENAKPSFTMVVFTKALKSFIRSGIEELGIDLKQVIHYEKWDGSPVDYVLVDEAQDFSKSEIDMLLSAKLKSIMIYGDTNQQIYRELKADQGGVLSIEEIAKYAKLPEKTLAKNYRLPKPIASFASYIGSDKSLEHACVKVGGEKPKVRKFDRWQDELEYIMSEIKTRNYTDVAIVLPFNDGSSAAKSNGHRNVEAVVKYLDSKSFPNEFKMHKGESDRMELDFDSSLPKILTFHSAKGLQFETVFIPFCDCANAWFVETYRNPFYVGATRTYSNLYLTYTGQLSPFLKAIPVGKYD